jgi:hypothetical protein
MAWVKPSGQDNLGEVLSGVFAHAIEHAGARPQDGPPETVGVSLDLGVEEADGGVLGPQELVGVVDVLPGLRDGPFGVSRGACLVRACAVVRVRLTGPLMRGSSYPGEFSHV